MKCDAKQRLSQMVAAFLQIENAGARGADRITEADLAEELREEADWYDGGGPTWAPAELAAVEVRA